MSGAPTFSVLIGLVSTEDGERIFETLRALRAQQGAHPHEVILADRRNDDLSRRIAAEFPEAILLPCPAGCTLPELRTRALERSTGRYAVVTEDHCVPEADWLEGFARAFREAPAGTAAVGGCVENGVHDSALDWATFLCEYSAFVAPVAEGSATVLPGMNIAYDGALLRAFGRERLASGFWESTVHPALLQRPGALRSTGAVRLRHSKRFTFGHFARQRYLYSRYYAGSRFGTRDGLARAIAFLASPLLPPLLLIRMRRHLRSRGRLGREFASALPLLAIFVMIWAWGEMVGYALGAGGALGEIE